MIILGDLQNKPLSENLAEQLNCEVIYPDVVTFPDTEQRVRVDADKVFGQVVYILKSIEMPVDSSVLQLAFLIDALNRAGADKVIGIIPYFPYMRADHVFRTGEAVPLELVIKLIEDAGVNEVILVDPHSIKIPEMFSVKVTDLSAYKMFARKIKEIEPDKNNISLVSPDMGGLRRLELVDEDLGGGINQVYINKERNYESGEVAVAEYKGEIKGVCFIIDDMIATGKTIAQAVVTLMQNGAEKVYIFATHPVFSAGASDLLQNSKVAHVFVTDSIPVTPEEEFEKLEVLSIGGLIASQINS